MRVPHDWEDFTSETDLSNGYSLKFFGARLFINVDKSYRVLYLFCGIHLWNLGTHLELLFPPSQTYCHNTCAKIIIPIVIIIILLMKFWPHTWLCPVCTELCFEIIIISHGSLTNYFACWPYVCQIISLHARILYGMDLLLMMDFLWLSHYYWSKPYNYWRSYIYWSTISRAFAPVMACL